MVRKSTLIVGNERFVEETGGTLLPLSVTLETAHDEDKKITRAKILLADVSHETELVRHDSQKIKNEILNIVARESRRRRT